MLILVLQIQCPGKNASVPLQRLRIHTISVVLDTEADYTFMIAACQPDMERPLPAYAMLDRIFHKIMDKQRRYADCLNLRCNIQYRIDQIMVTDIGNRQIAADNAKLLSKRLCIAIAPEQETEIVGQIQHRIFNLCRLLSLCKRVNQVEDIQEKMRPDLKLKIAQLNFLPLHLLFIALDLIGFQISRHAVE